MLLFIGITTVANAQWTQIGADINGDAVDDRFSLSSNGTTGVDVNGDVAGQLRVYEYFETKGTTVVSHTPTTNSIGTTPESDIVVTFSDDMDISTFTNANFTINGSYSGTHAATFSGDGTTEITCNPDVDFAHGELVTVTLTTNLQSSSAVALVQDYTWQFTTSTTGTGYLSNKIIISQSAASLIYSADIDGDGDMDMLTGNFGTDDFILYTNVGNEIFTEELINEDGGFVIKIADIDNDGDMDLLSSSVQNNISYWHENDGVGNFTTYTIFNEFSNIFASDINGDGYMDIITDYKWFENDGSQTFTEHDLFQDIKVISISDIDGDGDMDMLASNFSENLLNWYENDGSENFTNHSISTSSFYGTVTDMDNDGDMDILATSFSNYTVSWYENDGSQNFTENIINTFTGYPNELLALDIDGDNDMDAITTLNNKLYLYKNDGAGNFTDANISVTGRNIFPSDIDNDGDLDIVAFDDSKLVWYENCFAVISLTPTTDEINVALNSDIVVNFNSNVNETTVDNTTFLVSGSINGTIDGSFTTVDNVVTFNPTVDFIACETIYITITTTLADVNGHVLSNYYFNSFSTLDSEAPEIPILADVISECEVTIAPQTTTDACSGTITGSTATEFPITATGTTIVTWSFTDDAGNRVTADQNVIIEDLTAPTITCVENQTFELSENQTVYTVSGAELDPAATEDNCQLESVINDFNNLSTLDAAELPIGTTTITWIATDFSKNTETCNFDVLINEFVSEITEVMATNILTLNSDNKNDVWVVENIDGLITLFNGDLNVSLSSSLDNDDVLLKVLGSTNANLFVYYNNYN